MSISRLPFLLAESLAVHVAATPPATAHPNERQDKTFSEGLMTGFFPAAAKVLSNFVYPE